MSETTTNDPSTSGTMQDTRSFPGQPGEMWWYVHHNMLCEVLTEPAEVRRAYIRENKYPSEVPLRLRLLAPVRGALPPAVVSAGKTYVCAQKDYVRAQKDYAYAGKDYVRAKKTHDYASDIYDRTRKVYMDILTDHAEEIAALHRKECPDCPWDGETIFSAEVKI